MFFSYWSGHRRHLHSFPTRRSSDLHSPGAVIRRMLPSRPMLAIDAHDVTKTFKSRRGRSEEHTSELQSLTNLVCRLLLEKKKARAIAATQIKSRHQFAPAPSRSAQT